MRQQIGKFLLYLFGIPKTLYFNFRYLPFSQALTLPVVLSHRVILRKTGGRVSVDKKVKTGKIKIGFGSVQVAHGSDISTIIEIKGDLVFEGKAKIGFGSNISVDGTLTIGDRFNISAKSTVICKKRIRFGYHNLIAWDTVIMDSDLHEIRDKNGQAINPPQPIIFGDNVWVGSRCLILKGSEVGDNCVVAAGTKLNRKMEGNDHIIGGNPAAILKKVEGLNF